MRAGVALGSNLGDRMANLQAARARVCELTGVDAPLLASAVYETEPIGCEAGAGKFLNAVIEIGFAGEPRMLLDKLRGVEVALGRPSDHPRNASRPIDLDLLYVDGVSCADKHLQLPHPRLHERRFVLEPLAAIRPELVLPGQTQSVSELLRELADTRPLLRVASQW